jgi:hypothetical protein
MFTQALWSSFRILGLRAGPEDFPYDPGNGLTAACVALGIVVNAAAAAALDIPLAPAIVLGAATAGALGLYARLVLRARQLGNRIQQTFNSLLTTSSLVTLAMTVIIVPYRPMLPELREIEKHIKENPQTFDPSTIPLSLVLLSFLMIGVLLWQLAVTGHILRRAANLRLAAGILVTLLCMFSVACVKGFFSTLMSLPPN